MINIKKLFKSEGTHKGKVKVTRGGKTFYREQMVGQKEKIDVPKMSDMNFPKIAESTKENIEYKGKDKISEMNDDDIRTYIYDFTPKEYSHELGTGKQRDEFVESTLKEFKNKFLNKSEVIDLQKLMRGTGKTKVPVHRESGTKLEYRRTGKKVSPRAGTGKLGKFPESIKNKILELREIGYSGVKIKDYVEGMITLESEATGDLKDKIESLDNHLLMLSQEAARKDNTSERRDYIREKNKKLREERHELRLQSTGEEKYHVDGKVTNNLLSEGLINRSGKLTVTSQALTDWAKKQGVESTKKRTSAVESEKTKHEDTKKELNRADKKISELEVRAKHNLEEIKLVQQSKQESDQIRGELRRDNVDLKTKLKACLAGQK